MTDTTTGATPLPVTFESDARFASFKAMLRDVIDRVPASSHAHLVGTFRPDEIRDTDVEKYAAGRAARALLKLAQGGPIELEKSIAKFCSISDRAGAVDEITGVEKFVLQSYHPEIAAPDDEKLGRKAFTIGAVATTAAGAAALALGVDKDVTGGLPVVEIATGLGSAATVARILSVLMGIDQQTDKNLQEDAREAMLLFLKAFDSILDYAAKHPDYQRQKGAAGRGA